MGFVWHETDILCKSKNIQLRSTIKISNKHLPEGVVSRF